jgi:hypothetical protein
MLMPAPVVVDADVLLRNVDYAVRKGCSPALLAQPGRTLELRCRSEEADHRTGYDRQGFVWR